MLAYRQWPTEGVATPREFQVHRAYGNRPVVLICTLLQNLSIACELHMCHSLSGANLGCLHAGVASAQDPCLADSINLIQTFGGCAEYTVEFIVTWCQMWVCQELPYVIVISLSFWHVLRRYIAKTSTKRRNMHDLVGEVVHCFFRYTMWLGPSECTRLAVTCTVDLHLGLAWWYFFGKLIGTLQQQTYGISNTDLHKLQILLRTLQR